MAEQAKKAAPKRKTTTQRKTAAKRKPSVSKTTAKRTIKKTQSLQTRVSDVSRNAFLAGLGFYGMAFDQVQEQVKSVEGELSARRKKADKLYQDMVKRGTKVEKQAKNAIDDIELPKLDVAGLNIEKLEARLEQAKARFEDLKETVGFSKAA
ncbi:MAG: hypothetical protein AB8B57_00365 [Congregibacter sp.]